MDRIVAGARSLDEPVLLVIDDLHHLLEPTALAQLELLLDRRPAGLRVILSTRHDPPLGLHRLRLAGDLTELRAADLRFELDETKELLSAAGIALSDASVASLNARTEGWVAGLRLAALSLAGGAGRGAVRRRVLRQRAHGRRLPVRGGPPARARAGAPAPAADVDPRSG